MFGVGRPTLHNLFVSDVPHIIFSVADVRHNKNYFFRPFSLFGRRSEYVDGYDGFVFCVASSCVNREKGGGVFIVFDDRGDPLESSWAPSYLLRRRWLCPCSDDALICLCLVLVTFQAASGPARAILGYRVCCARCLILFIEHAFVSGIILEVFTFVLK